MTADSQRILIVDDDIDICANLRDILEDVEYLVDVATTGEDAVRLATANQYHVAVVDYKLPLSNGIEIFKALRDCEPSVLGILVTAYAGDNASIALKSGFAQVMSKPVDLHLLLPIIARLMNQWQNSNHGSEPSS